MNGSAVLVSTYAARLLTSADGGHVVGLEVVNNVLITQTRSESAKCP
jgi:hypothetical protein